MSESNFDIPIVDQLNQVDSIPLTPEARAFGQPKGTPVVLTDGDTWILARHPPALRGIWDSLFDDNILAGRYKPGELCVAAMDLLMVNYDMSVEEAFGLVVHMDDPQVLVAPVEYAMLGDGRRHGTRSDWIDSSLMMIGKTMEEIRPDLLPFVLEQLVETGKAVSEEAFISSVQAQVARANLLGKRD